MEKFKDFENFENLKKSLDTSEGLKNVERTTTKNCDMGCFYDFSNDRAKSIKLNLSNENILRQDIKQKLHISEPIFQRNTDGYQTCLLHVTYEDYKEIINSADISIQPNIKDSIFAHYVSSRMMGFQSVIELSVSKDYNGNNLINIVDILLGKATLEKSLNKLSQIQFSVSGNLPLDFKYDSSTLHDKSLKFLQSLCDAKFYESQKIRFLLRVGICPLNLESYFHPLFEKLADLYEMECSESVDTFNWIVGCIKKNVLNKILSAAELIKSGKDYHPISQFLQNIYRSILLNKEEVEGLITSLNESVTKEVDQMQCVSSMNENRPYSGNFHLTILYKISLSLDKHQNLLKECIFDYFNTNGKEKLYHSQMIKLFEGSLQEDCANIRAKVEEKDVMRCKWQSILRKNVSISCDVAVSSGSMDKAQFEVRLCSNGVPIDPQIPVLDPPIKIRKIEASKTCIKLAWTLPEEVDSSLICFYRIDYRRMSNESFGRWHTVFTDNRELEAIVDDLQPGGIYVFRVQSSFVDFVGVWSDYSFKIQTAATSLYSPALKAYIGQPLGEKPVMGPIIGLNENGECYFHQRYDFCDYWNNIVCSTSQLITTRPILLTDRMNGMIVMVTLYPYSGYTFYIKLVAPQCKINQQKKFPLSVNLRVKFLLTNGSHYTTNNHKFAIKALCSNSNFNDNNAQPDNFLVTVPIGTRSCNQPEIILQFSV